jgi:integrase
MNSRRLRRDEWRRTKNGTWTCSFGRRGDVQVRLFENRDSGFYYADVRAPGHQRAKRTLGTADRTEAGKQGQQIYLGLLSVKAEGPVAAPQVVRLGELCERFVKECPMLLDNTKHGQDDARLRLAILRSAVGDARDVRTLTANDVRHYEARRKHGGIPFRGRNGDDRLTNAVRQRTVQADLKLLKQVLYWACTVTGADGRPWLDRNPIGDVEVRGEHDVKRPIAVQERFDATIAAMKQLQEKYAAEALLTCRRERERAESRWRSWVRAELGLVLLEATGRRRGAIMGLSWEDFDFAGNRITWRPECDKKRKKWVVTYPTSFFETLREFQQRLGVVSGPVFPSTKDEARSAPAELLSQWIRKAEVDAKLPKLDGGTCHPYRRKWRSERPHHPLTAVAYAGGWTDFDTMMRCYDIPEDADILAVTSETRKRRDVFAARANSSSA